MPIYTIHTKKIKWTDMWMFSSSEMKWFPDAKRADPPLILLQESRQQHIWLTAPQTVSSIANLVCPHEALFWTVSSLCLSSRETHTAGTFSLLSFPCLSVLSFILFFLLTLFPSFYSFFSNLYSDSNKELFLVRIKSLLIWVENLEKAFYSICLFIYYCWSLRRKNQA